MQGVIITRALESRARDLEDYGSEILHRRVATSNKREAK